MDRVHQMSTFVESSHDRRTGLRNVHAAVIHHREEIPTDYHVPSCNDEDRLLCAESGIQILQRRNGSASIPDCLTTQAHTVIRPESFRLSWRNTLRAQAAQVVTRDSSACLLKGSSLKQEPRDQQFGMTLNPRSHVLIERTEFRRSRWAWPSPELYLPAFTQ
jgi:hypothetical protein